LIELANAFFKVNHSSGTDCQSFWCPSFSCMMMSLLVL
jgi:hypothetical protein